MSSGGGNWGFVDSEQNQSQMFFHIKLPILLDDCSQMQCKLHLCYNFISNPIHPVIKEAFHYWQYRWTSHRGKSGNFNWIYDLLLKMSKVFYVLSWIASSAIEDLKESMRHTLTTDKPGWHMVLSFLQYVMEPLNYLGNFTSSVAQIYSDLVWVLRG